MENWGNGNEVVDKIGFISSARSERISMIRKIKNICDSLLNCIEDNYHGYKTRI